LVTSLAELPALTFDGVVIANELLDNLSFHLLERGRDEWLEVRVGEDDGRLVEVLVPAPPDLADEAVLLAAGAPVGGRVPLQHHAVDWVRAALSTLDRGRVVAVDYADDTASMAGRPWSEWVRTYRSHGRGGRPLDGPGTQDVTCEVAVDQLARVARPELVRSQAEFLGAHGMGELTAAAAAEWEAGAARGDLESLRARSRVGEARALADPAGLGGFTVVEWAVRGRRRRRAASPRRAQ
jgi:SAM-dependent MidA family methyltransferase